MPVLVTRVAGGVGPLSEAAVYRTNLGGMQAVMLTYTLSRMVE